jgi:hypothetical protein
MDDQATALNTEIKGSVAVVGPAPPGSHTPTGGICVQPTGGGQIAVRIDTILIGHAFPSGAAQDRRAWLEVIGYDNTNAVVFSTGIVPDGMDPEDVIASGTDPNFTGFWDKTFDASGQPAHFFWDVASHDAGTLLKPPTTLDPNSMFFDHSTTAHFVVGAALAAKLDHITARVRVRPLPIRLLNELNLQSLIPNLHTLDIQASMVEWKAATAAMTFTNCNDDDP